MEIFEDRFEKIFLFFKLKRFLIKDYWVLIVYVCMYVYGKKEGNTEEENNCYPVVFKWNFRESAVPEFTDPVLGLF